MALSGGGAPRQQHARARVALRGGADGCCMRARGLRLPDQSLLVVLFETNPSLWEAPKSWPQVPVQPYTEYIAAGQEVIDS